MAGESRPDRLQVTRADHPDAVDGSVGGRGRGRSNAVVVSTVTSQPDRASHFAIAAGRCAPVSRVGG